MTPKPILPLLFVLLLLCACTGKSTVEGKATYDQYCARCHSGGNSGAPQLNNPKAWEKRLTKGEEALAVHSIHGYSGPTGIMPARGGHAGLSNASVRDAVAYMMEQLHTH